MYLHFIKVNFILTLVLYTTIAIGSSAQVSPEEALDNFRYKDLIIYAEENTVVDERKTIYEYIANYHLGNNGITDSILIQIQNNIHIDKDLIRLINTFITPIKKDKLEELILRLPPSLSFGLVHIAYMENKINEIQFLDFAKLTQRDDQANFIRLTRKLNNTSGAERKKRYQRAKEIYLMAKNNDWLLNYYTVKALIHYGKMSKNSDVTENLLLEAKRISLSTCNNCKANLNNAKVIKELASHYRRQRKGKISIEHFREYISIMKNHSKINNYEYQDSDHTTYMIMGQVYYDDKNYENAIKYFNKAIDVLNNFVNKDSKLFAQRNLFYNNCIALCYAKNKEYDKALKITMPLYEKLYESKAEDFIWLPEVLHSIANYYYKIGDIDNAKKFYIKSIEQIGGKYLEEFENCDEYSQLLGSLMTMSRRILPMENIDNRIKHNDFTIDFISHITSHYQNYKRKNRLLKSTDKWFDKEIEYFANKYIEKNNEKILNHLFMLCTFSKSIDKQIISSHSNLTQKQIKLNEKIDSIRKLIQLNKGSHNSKSELKILQIEYDIINEPRNIKLKTNFIATEKRKSRSQELYIDITELDASYLIMYLIDNSWSIKLLPNKSSINQKIDALRYNIYAPFLTCSLDQKRKPKSENQSYYIFNLLFSDFDMSEIKTVVINPDSKFNLIPYDALQDSNSDKYLIQYSDTYISTIDNYFLENQKTISINEVSLFGPEFTSRSDDYCEPEEHRQYYLGPLLYNKEEIENIKSVYRSISYTGEDASTANFKNQYEQSKFIHLATHSKVDYNNGDFSYIAFTNSDQNEDKIYLLDVQNYKSKAECVILSSCDSGVGTYTPGLGINSLTQALLNSGVKSVISSLWSVNDRSTSMIMKNFYTSLDTSQSKSKALRNAKLAYINKVDPEYKHPYYWAGFMAYGNMRKVEIKKTKNNLSYFLISSGLLILTFLYFVKK